MSSTLAGATQKVRLKCDCQSPGQFYATNLKTNAPCIVYRGDETVFELGLFVGSAFADVTKFSQIKLLIKAVESRGETAPNPNADILHLATAYASSEDEDAVLIDTSVDATAWADGSKAHATFNIALSNISKGEVWVIIKGIAASGAECTYLSARAVSAESGNSSTLTATEAEIASISDGITDMKNAALSAIDAAQTAAVAQIDSTTTLSLVSLADAGAITLSQGNACYTLVAAQANYSITVSATPSATKLTQIMLQLKIGATAPTISWGTEYFFKNKIPVINANSSYDVLYEYDSLREVWVCACISK